MYFYILDPSSSKIDIIPEVADDPTKAPWKPNSLSYVAHVIIAYSEKRERFGVVKNRFGNVGMAFSDVHHLAEEYLGIRLWEEGFFISDKEKMLFLLKYSGLTSHTLVDFPLIPMYNTNTEKTD